MLQKHLNNLLITFYCALLFFVPLIWTPFTRELFEFPKMLTVYFFTGSIVFVFILKALILGRLRIKRTPLDIPIVLFVLIYSLATVLSIHFKTSFFGYYTRYHGGLLSLVCYVLLFYIFVSEFNNLEPFLISLFLSVGLVSIWGILEHFGIDRDYWVQDVQSRVFSTMGQPNWLAAFLAVSIPPILGWGLYFVRNKHWRIASFLGFISFIYYVCFWFTYSLSGLAGLVSGIFLLIALLRGSLDFNQKKYLLITVLVFFVFSAAFPGLFEARIDQLRDILVSKITVLAQARTISHPGSTVRIRFLVWKGAWQTFLSRPILGYGPETFAFSFLPNRPEELNLTDEWDFLYNKAHNEYLDLLCNTGFFGLGAFLLLVFLTIICWFKLPFEKAELSVGFLSGIAAYLISNFFGFSVVATATLFWFYLAFIALSAVSDVTYIRIKIYDFLPRIVTGVILVIGFSFFVSFIFRIFWADVRYARGLQLEGVGEYLLASSEIKKAVVLNPLESSYKRDLSGNLAQAALSVSDADTVAYLVAWADDSAQAAYVINPRNSLTLKELTKTYYDLALVDSYYVTSAQKMAEEMVNLSPTDAKAYYNLGLVYVLKGDTEAAKTALNKAVNLRPQYIDAVEVLNDLESIEEE